MAKSIVNSEVSDILERHIESRRWMKDNYYGELTEVYRAIKMRTKPIPKKDQTGRKEEKEDKSRTNIAMPGINIAYRRGVARLTAQPYQLRYTGNAAPEILEMLSALAIQQYDRSDESKVDRRIVMQAKAFGFSYSKVRRDTVSRTMQFRRALVKDGKYLYRDRASVRHWQGVPDNEIAQELDEKGPDLSDQEVGQFLQRSGYETQVPDMTDEGMAQFIAQNGYVMTVPVDVRKYEGPIVKWVFIGDLDLQPGCLSLNLSDYAIESFTETDLWLKDKVDNLKYQDEQGQWVPAFDPDACQRLLDNPPDKDRKIDDLREWFLGVSARQGQDQYQFPKRLRIRKQFDILEQHAQGEDGRNWITWISPNYRDTILGKMPYPEDLYGKTYYTEMVPFDDLLDSYGDSTPRMMRYLHALDNRTVAQNYDMISNQLRRFLITPQGFELGDDVIIKGLYRQLETADPNRVRVLDEPPIPPGAFERESMIQRRMAQIDPNLNTVDTGTASNPMAGKLATTAMLNAKASDALTQFELDGRDLYLKELGQKKLWINQQMAGTIDPWQIEEPYWGAELKKRVENLPAMTPESPSPAPQWAISDRYGKTVAVRLDPLEIQEDLGVEPVAGSYLAVDDDIRRAAAVELDQAAMAAPDILDRRKVARFHLSTIRNLDGKPDDYILPEQTGPTPPPFKGNISVSIPLDKEPADIVNQVLPLMGLQPSQELANRDTLDAVSRMNQAGKDADELTKDAETQSETAKHAATLQAKSKANGKPKAPVQ